METIASTEATPRMMPMVASALRNLCRARSRRAVRRASKMFMSREGSGFRFWSVVRNAILRWTKKGRHAYVVHRSRNAPGEVPGTRGRRGVRGGDRGGRGSVGVGADEGRVSRRAAERA